MNLSSKQRGGSNPIYFHTSSIRFERPVSQSSAERSSERQIGTPTGVAP